MREVNGIHGTSLGGERPKMTVGMDGAWWLAKLQDRGDAPHMPAREYAAMKLARMCEINAAEVRFATAGARELLLVRRFDRELSPQGVLRRGFASAHTVLHLDAQARGDTARSYVRFSHEMRRWCGDDKGQSDDMRRELWRRMALNALLGNGDDHPRNHGLLWDEQGKWGLAPAYDIVPFPRFSGMLAMAVTRGGSHLASCENLIETAPQFTYTVEQAEDVLRSMARIVRDHWRGLLMSCGLDDQETEAVAPAFQLAEAVAGY